MSGLSRQDYMTNAILNAPIKVFATRNVIDSCKSELLKILSELKRVKEYGELDADYRHELRMIVGIIEATMQEKAFNHKTKGKMKVQLGILSLARSFYQVVLPSAIKT